ncbi:MAG TPA: RHS repeat-associated core domain-containing protein, partial [Polyangia bacterium]|nr:RHS repeat-associated core domain-containing protein [Polyangia bacterium]
MTFERDQVGRVLKELVGDDWVASEYDVLGMRVGVQSSKGLRQRIARNGMGDVVGVRVGIADDDAAAERAVAERDGEREREAERGGGGVPGGGRGPGNASGGGGTGGETWEARFERDTVGLELERALPGGVRARWERDQLGRPKKHSIWAGDLARGAWQYSWEVNDRLRKVVDLLRGPTQYRHDALGNLAAAVYADGRLDLRMPDAVGNLFHTEDRSDRRYGPAGQLFESRAPDGGLTRYGYDPEGNLIKKVRWDPKASTRLPPEGTAPENTAREVWTYHWNGAGMLSKVIRPDGDTVEFTYDALGRRLSKTYLGRHTRWIWDGNVPLHEWVEVKEPQPSAEPAALPAATADEIAANHRRAELNERPAQGPPPRVPPPPAASFAPSPSILPPGTPAPSIQIPGVPAPAIVAPGVSAPSIVAGLPAPGVPEPGLQAHGYGPATAAPRTPAATPPSAAMLAAAAQGGTAESPITWVFEPESFAPLAKLVGDARYSLVTDHLGTPKAMFDATGAEVWSASIDAYGDLRDLKGHRQSCPFRYPGQYEDQETGLYYNVLRYFDSATGSYIGRDPLGLVGGLA